MLITIEAAADSSRGSPRYCCQFIPSIPDRSMCMTAACPALVQYAPVDERGAPGLSLLRGPREHITLVLAGSAAEHHATPKFSTTHSTQTIWQIHTLYTASLEVFAAWQKLFLQMPSFFQHTPLLTLILHYHVQVA